MPHSVADFVHSIPCKVREADPLSLATALLDRLRVGFVPVVRGDALVGVVEAGVERAGEGVRVDQRMTTHYPVTSPETTFHEASTLLERDHAQRLCVVDDRGRWLGFITAADLAFDQELAS
jgi:CBS domain-containing protein